MNRRDFLRNLVAAIVLPHGWRWRKTDEDEHVVFFPAVMRRAFGGCVPSSGTPFRLDVSRLDSGHVLSCKYAAMAMPDGYTWLVSNLPWRGA